MGPFAVNRFVREGWRERAAVACALHTEFLRSLALPSKRISNEQSACGDPTGASPVESPFAVYPALQLTDRYCCRSLRLGQRLIERILVQDASSDMTERWLIDEVSRLSSAQLAFKPAPDAWSIMQVVDHLVVVGPIYWQDQRSRAPLEKTNRLLHSRTNRPR